LYPTSNVAHLPAHIGQWNFVRIFREKGDDAEKYQQYEKNAKAY